MMMLSIVSSGGCGDENPASPSTGSMQPHHLSAVSIDDSTVDLRWSVDAGSAGIRYSVAWKGESNSHSGMFESVGREHVRISSLEDQTYTFHVTAHRGGESSTPVAIRWAPATRVVFDSSGSTVLRIYESGSLKGSGLVLDPERGGPLRVQVFGASPAQIALFTTQTGTDNFEIGTAYSRLGQPLDTSVYISTRTYKASSLDEWFHDQPLDSAILPDGNRRLFLLPASIPDAQGRGFFVRLTGRDGHHYARVLIRNVEGRLLQGAVPDRFIEVMISYQKRPDVPFAGTMVDDDRNHTPYLLSREKR
jgi:hypothetical protein